MQFNKYAHTNTHTGQPMGPQVDTANIRTVLRTNHVDSRSFSSRRWAFRRTHPSADPIRPLGIRLALPLTLSLPSGFVPCTKLMVGASPRALGLVKDFSCDCMFWDDRGGGLAGQPMGPQVCVCVFSSHPFWTSSSLDVPAGVTQEEGHTGFLIHLPSAVRALIFVARRIQPFLSLVDREVKFCVLTN